MLCRADHASHCQKGNLLPLIEYLSSSILHRPVEFLQAPVCLSPRIADSNRAVKMIHRKIQLPAQLPKILRRQHSHVRNRCQVRQIKDPLMCLAVTSHQAGPIQRKHHRQILDTDIMQDLIISPLQKGRIHCHHRLETGRRHPCRRSHCMLLRNPHIKETFRVTPGKCLQPCSVRHRRRDRDHPRILSCQTAQLPGEYIRITWIDLFLLRLSGRRIKRLHSVKTRRIPLCRQISLAFFCIHMNQYRMIQLLCLPENLCHRPDIMSVHWSEIGNAHIFKQHSRNHQLFDAVLGPADLIHQPLPEHRNLHQRCCHILFQPVIAFSGTDPVQIF